VIVGLITSRGTDRIDHERQRREYSYLHAIIADFATMMITAFLSLFSLH
jgi:hypothetical protein